MLWGLFGPGNARFISFVRGPCVAFDDRAGLARFSCRRYIRHSPAGGAMTMVLGVMIVAMEGRGPRSVVGGTIVLPAR